MLLFYRSFARIQLFVLEAKGKKTNMCRQALSHYNHFITRIDLPAQNTDPANPRLGLWKQSARVTEGRF